MANGNEFNPLDVIENLQNVGVPADQAKILARALSQVAENTAATKHDLDITKMEIKRDIKDIDGKIENVRAELKRDIADIKRDIKSLENALILKLTGIFAALLAIFKYLPLFFKQ